MDWQAIGAIGETIGAMAVLVTLLYLARQVRHARREQQIDAVRANRNERRDYFTTARDSQYLPAIICKAEAGEQLSPEESLRLSWHTSASWGLVYSEWVQAQLELPGEFATSEHFRIAVTLAQPGGAEWFLAHGERLYPSRFVAHVKRIQADLDTSHSHMRVASAARDHAALDAALRTDLE